MNKPAAAAEKVKNTLEEKGRETTSNPWVEKLARFGYAVRGLLYMVVGFLALQVALGRGGENTDKNGAIAAIGAQPFGKFLLILVVVGLVGYSLWGFIRAFLDPLDRGTDPKGIAQRAGYVVSGLSYGALVLPTVKFIMGSGDNGSGSNASQDMSAALMSAPFGPWLVGLVGLIAMGGGLGQMFQAYTADFKKDFKTAEMSQAEKEWSVRVGRFGLAARGVVFAMLGFFLIQAALHTDPKEARGLDGALGILLQQPYGPWLLGIVALGLISFGVFSALSARWIRIKG